MTTPLTAEQAITLLRQQPHAYQAPEQLRALAAQVDANPAGRITVLYSGPSAKGVWSSQIIDSMSGQATSIPRVLRLGCQSIRS